MNLLKSIQSWINKLSFGAFYAAAIAGLILIILTTTSVLARYLFHISYIWFDELLWHFFGVNFLLGTAYTLRTGGHVRVDIFYSRYPPKVKAWVDLLLACIFMLPVCGLLTYYGTLYAFGSYQILEASDSSGGMPYRFLIKSAIPLGFSILFLQGLSFIIQQICIIKNQPIEKPTDL